MSCFLLPVLGKLICSTAEFDYLILVSCKSIIKNDMAVAAGGYEGAIPDFT
jgi:hypothetical protein